MEQQSSSILADDDLAKFHRGEEILFSALIGEYSPRLLATTRSFAPSQADARDLLQETWRQIYSKRALYSASGPLLGWCLAICRNVCLAAVRREGRIDLEPHDFDQWQGSARFSPETLAERAALRRAALAAIRRLPVRERAVFVYRLIEQRTTRETAAALNCAEGTVKATLHHAVRKLQRSMRAWES